VASKFLREYPDTFENLVKVYTEKVYSLQPNLIDILDANVIDIGGPLTLKTETGEIKLSTGPMKKEQSIELFKFEKELPEVAIYFEMDYYSVN
jgi:hypothetical protein